MIQGEQEAAWQCHPGGIGFGGTKDVRMARSLTSTPKFQRDAEARRSTAVLELIGAEAL